MKFSDEDRAAKQSEVTLLMDEVERAQTMLLSLERQKVPFTSFYLILKFEFFIIESYVLYIQILQIMVLSL